MNNVIVGTAGHVDHGKTCLIKALTGIDTDRLKEEKKRGITIELGFAEMPNEFGINISFIDVPGHERFIKNMLAGIGGIDLVLLVIAADEGIMPQTREHVEILERLNIRQGIIALTKVDMVDEEWLDAVKEDIKDYSAGTFLQDAPILEVSAYTGQNIDMLKKLICDMAVKSSKRKEDPELLRIPIDRVFTIDGFGTVVTGTLIQGTIAVGDEIEIYPVKKLAKVRNLQVHGHMVEKAYAGQRTAVNLTNIRKEELKRGDVLAAKGTLTPSMMLDVKIDMFRDSPRILKNSSRLHFYYGSAEALCKVVLLDAEYLESGQTGFAQIRLEEEVALKKGDRFILRFYSPLESIGGGIVIDANPPRRKRYHAETINALNIKLNNEKDALLEQVLIEESSKLRSLSDIARGMGVTNDEINQMVKPLLNEKTAVKLTENLVVHRTYLDLVKEKTTELLNSYHARNPIAQGVIKEEFRKKLSERLYIKDNKLIDTLIVRLKEDKLISDNRNYIALKDFRIIYTPGQQDMKDRFEAEYRKRCFEMPDIDELLAKERDKLLAKQLIEALQMEGRLVKLNYNYYMHADCMEKAMALLRNAISENGRITLSQYRDLLGTSRKYAIMILEYFDQQKITRLIDDARALIVKKED